MEFKAQDWISFKEGYIDFDGNKIESNIYFENKETGELFRIDIEFEEGTGNEDEFLSAEVLDWFWKNEGSIKSEFRKEFWQQQK
jgi:hypothetical protein